MYIHTYINYYSSESVKISTGFAREGVESQAGLAGEMLLVQVLGESGDTTNKEPMYKNKSFWGVVLITINIPIGILRFQVY